MSIERLRALENKWREMANDRANAEWVTLVNCANDLRDLIAELGQEVAPVAWLKELDGGAVKCVPRDFPGAFPVYRESTPLRCKDGQPGDRNRPAQEPGGVECMKCGCIFIGEEWHSVCAVCLDKPGSERLCDFFADVGEVARFMDELCNVVTELTGDEGEDDPITVLRRHIASSPAHTSEARDCPAQFFASGPQGDFFTADSKFANHLILVAGYDRDDWTVTDLYAAMRQEAE